MSNFYNDLAIGKRGESLVAAALAARGHIVEDKSEDKAYQFNDIDFLLINKAGQQTTLEVKNDLASERTGNLFIETYNEYNRSHSYKGWFFYCGATYICFIQEHSGKAHIIAFDDLRQAIETKKYREISTSTTKGYLLPVAAVETLPSYFCLLLENNVSRETIGGVKQ